MKLLITLLKLKLSLLNLICIKLFYLFDTMKFFVFICLKTILNFSIRRSLFNFKLIVYNILLFKVNEFDNVTTPQAY